MRIDRRRLPLPRRALANGAGCPVACAAPAGSRRAKKPRHSRSRFSVLLYTAPSNANRSFDPGGVAAISRGLSEAIPPERGFVQSDFDPGRGRSNSGDAGGPAFRGCIRFPGVDTHNYNSLPLDGGGLGRGWSATRRSPPTPALPHEGGREKELRSLC
jgi:hypothetical protein